MSRRSYVCSLVAALAAVCVPGVVFAEATGVSWRNNLDAAKIEAAQSGRLVLLHFYTRTCAPCKLLDQNVLSQPHVGLAVEREYVPVKIDADAAPALANMYKIDRVPSEVVLTPQGNVVAMLSTPDNPDGYVAQLQNLSRHFRQTTPANGSAPAINSAYASLPSRPAIDAPATVAAPVSAPAAQGVPQQQGNPFVAATPAVPPTNAMASNGVPTMPTNAMPRSYRNPMFSGPPVTTGAAPAAAAAGVASAPAVTAPPAATAGAPVTPPATNAAYAALGAATSASATQAAPAVQAAPGVATPVTPAAPATQIAAAAATTIATQAPAVRQAPRLPAGCPPLAFDGCCPVTLKLLNKWEQGIDSFGAIHRGRTYLFAGEEQRKQFLANPDSFSPVFAGYDPVLLLDRQQSVPGSRKFGFKYGDAFYLFSSAETKSRFEASPQTYAAGVRQAMARIDGTPGSTLRR